MKKTVILIAAALLMAGCSANSQSADTLEKSFTCTIKTSDGFAGSVERAEGSGWNYKLTEPASVSGLEVSILNEGKFVWSLENHSAVCERSEMPQYSPLALACSALDMCVEGKGIASEVKDGKTVRSGTVKGIAFKAVSENGKLLTLSFSGGETLTFNG